MCQGHYLTMLNFSEEAHLTHLKIQQVHENCLQINKLYFLADLVYYVYYVELPATVIVRTLFA